MNTVNVTYMSEIEEPSKGSDKAKLRTEAGKQTRELWHSEEE